MLSQVDITNFLYMKAIIYASVILWKYIYKWQICSKHEVYNKIAFFDIYLIYVLILKICFF